MCPIRQSHNSGQGSIATCNRLLLRGYGLQSITRERATFPIVGLYTLVVETLVHAISNHVRVHVLPDGQVPSLHGRVSVSVPGHVEVVVCSVHSRVRDCWPDPHVTEHGPQSPHADHCAAMDSAL